MNYRFYKTAHEDFDADGRITGQLYADPVARKYLFQHNGKYYVSDDLGPKLLVDDVEYVTDFYVKNGKNYWKFGGSYLWYDGSKYVISSKLGWSTEEEWVEVYDEEDNYLPDDSYWDGDAWWSCSSLTGEYTPRGILKNNEDSPVKVVEIAPMTGHRSDTLLGLYQELDEDGEPLESENTITVGLPQFKDQDGATYTRSLEASGGYYTYGSIRHDGEGWLIGTRDSADGWWEGQEPDLEDSVTFDFRKLADSEIEDQEDLTITFDQYVSGDVVDTDNRICEVSTWQR